MARSASTRAKRPAPARSERSRCSPSESRRQHFDLLLLLGTSGLLLCERSLEFDDCALLFRDFAMLFQKLV
jgi:hypothetical protein